jgi:hypothetical protein
MTAVLMSLPPRLALFAAPVAVAYPREAALVKAPPDLQRPQIGG